MRRKATLVVLGLLGLLLGSCGFSKEQFLGDAAPPPVTIGFAQESQLQDESSGAIQVIVRLSRPAAEAITVDFAFAAAPTNPATPDEDYAATPSGTLTFEPGITERAIDLEIRLDSIDQEPDEMIRLTLSNPSSGAQLGMAQHTITISSVLLPRVSFTVATSMEDEANALTLQLMLDRPAQSMSTATVQIRQTSTAAPNYDFMVPANLTVTFPVTTESQTISIPINNDTIDEDPETVVVEIATTTGVVIGTLKEHARTIMDNDNPPTVQFSVSSANANEGSSATAVTADIVVQLSGPSGKVVTVPVTYGGGTATETADYGYNAKAMLTFNPAADQNPAGGETSKTITISIAGDTIDEDNQTVITSLVDAPMNATIGTPATHTFTINDDDMAPTIGFMTANQTVGEGDSGTTTTTYTMELSAASERPIQYTIALTGTATIPMDYTTVPVQNAGNTSTTIDIAPGATTATIDLVVIGDEVSEGMTDETIVMTISNMNLMNVRAIGGNAVLQRTHTIDDFDP